MPTKLIRLYGTSPLVLNQRFTGHKARGGGPGGAVWPCGESLAIWLAEHLDPDVHCGDSHAHLDPDVHCHLASKSVQSVLELGCGTGVVGLALAALLGAHTVTATDGDAASCTLCSANAASCGLPIDVRQLVWGGGKDSQVQLESILSRLGHGGRCAQWLVGADVVYHPQSEGNRWRRVCGIFYPAEA